MRECCEWFVDLLCEICVKFVWFYTALVFNVVGVEKAGGLPTAFGRVFRVFFHYQKRVFQSVSSRFLPTFNMPNNYNYEVILNFNYYWRVSG